MATYALTYATRADFDASLVYGDIYTLMQGVTSVQPSVAITAHITETGETFICGTNVMTDIKSVGPGDYVLYDTASKQYMGIASKWLDNNYPGQPTQHVLIVKEGVLPLRFVVCGTVVKRFGNRIRIAGRSVALPWSKSGSDYEWLVSAIPSNTSVLKKSGTYTTDVNTAANCAFPSSRYQEAVFPAGDATYLPITRTTWEAAVAAGAETVSQNGKTATLADYGYLYDKWLSHNWSPKFPAATGVYADASGHGNTRKIVADFVANHGKDADTSDYAAGYCFNYTPDGAVPGLGKHAWFLGTIDAVGELLALSHTLMHPLAWKGSRFWSSSQYNKRYGWVANANGSIGFNNKNSGAYAVPLADIIISN